MAQAAMSDVNLCASKALSAFTALARRVSARATVLRYHATLNQHAQSHLGHTAHANSLLLFKPPQTTAPFSQSQFGMLLRSQPWGRTKIQYHHLSTPSQFLL